MNRTKMLSRATNVALAVCALSFCSLGASLAAPTDMVPRGSAVNDWMATLAADGMLGSSVHPSDFTSEQRYDRAQLASIFEKGLLNDSANMQRLNARPVDAALARQVARFLQPQLAMDQADPRAVLTAIDKGGVGLGLTLQPQLRIRAGGDRQPGSSVVGIFRGVAAGELGRDGSYRLSLSNWYRDYRRPMYNDLGDRDFRMVNEGYIDIAGKNGFDFSIGRMYDNWSSAWLGGTLLSDNSPAFDEMKVEFPFSLGANLGRNYRYTQTASTFRESGVRRYWEARRIEYQFSQHWTADFEEAFKTTKASSLVATPFPFLIGKGLDEKNYENYFNYSGNIGLTYAANQDTRVYGQLFIDDFKSPFRGRFLGLSLGKGGVTPQKLSYVIGATTQTSGGTSATIEYQYADPTTYTFHTSSSPWTHGTFDWIAEPSGPNSRQLFGRLSQRLPSGTVIAFEARDRRRRDNSYPAPTAREYGIYLTQPLGKRDSIQIAGHDYRQDAFPFMPGQPGYPPDSSLAPLAFANSGTTERIKQVDMTYSITF